MELVCFAAGSVLYLVFMRQRPAWANIAVAVVGVALLLLLAWRDEERIWGPAPQPFRERLKGASWDILPFSLLLALCFALAGICRIPGEERVRAVFDGTAFPLRFPLALACYIPYAWLQQAIVQFYLLGRLRVVRADAEPIALAGVNGLIFGALHLNSADWAMITLTVVGGVVWTRNYQRHRCLLPLALSHALLGGAYFQWIRGEDLLDKLLRALPGAS